MAVVVTLDRVLAERCMTLTELSHRVGVTLANLSVLKSGRARAIRFSTLEAICRELGCQPADLLAYTAQDDADEEPAASDRAPTNSEPPGRP